jgi:hypothetical protein
VVAVASVVVLAAWTYVLPPQFESVRGLNLRALPAWRGLLAPRFSGWLTPPSLQTARAVFRGLTVAGWLGYGTVVWCVFRGARFGGGWTWPVAVPLVLLLAVAMPPVLSTDVFAYIGYGRLSVVHGLNPHLHTQVELVRLGDPTAPFLHWPIASPYGPLWTLISMAAVRVAPAGAVLGSVIALKVVAGLALLGAAAAGRALVARVDPSRAAGTFVLVALNPLLLLEGPGSGHNDVAMVALVLAALVFLSSARPAAAALLLGAAAAIKLVPLVLVPLLALVAARAAATRRRSSVGADVGASVTARVAAAVLSAALALAPVVAAYVPFWEGPRTLGGLGQRWGAGDPDRTAPAPAPTPAPTGAASPARAMADDSDVRLPWRILTRTWPVLLLFLWAAVAVAMGEGEHVFRLATVWGLLSLAIMLVVAGMWFPWYLAWTWPVAVLRFTRPHLVLMGFLLPFSLMLMLAYALPPG